MDIGIIGGGIIGLCSAYYLQKAGYQVTIFEQNALAEGCSMGNAGMIVPSHIIPLAQPGMIAKGLRWMLSPTSPFYVKPRLNADLMRWGWLFYRHSTSEHVERAIPALRDLSLFSKKLYQELARPGLAANGDADGRSLDFGWHERGLLMLYKTLAAEHDMAEEADVANRAGVEARTLTGQQVQDLEPDARVTVRGGILYPGDAHLDPGRLVHTLITYLRRQGVTIHDQTTVTGLARERGRVTMVQTNTGDFPVDELVVAGGAWSSLLARKLALRLPLQGGKGYSFMLPGVDSPGVDSPGVDSPGVELPGVTDTIRVPAIMLEARATATPIGNDLRFAGTLEVAGTDLSVNMNRVRGIVQSINQYYPDVRVDMPRVEAVWSGLRPCSPDGLPYIGRVPQAENVVVATGHGMMGLSLGPATGKLVADVIAGNRPAVELAPFAPGRFSG